MLFSHSSNGSSFEGKQHILTLVTPMMVNTSPLQKGRSCSLAVWKLYLAMHSVPVDHGACITQDRREAS